LRKMTFIVNETFQCEGAGPDAAVASGVGHTNEPDHDPADQF
jgi:hypothetical protein